MARPLYVEVEQAESERRGVVALEALEDGVHGEHVELGPRSATLTALLRRDTPAARLRVAEQRAGRAVVRR